MKLFEIATNSTNRFTVRVNQQFSDASFDFPFIDGKEWDDITQVPEQLTPLVFVVTPVEDDYRGRSEMSNDYASAPELGFYVGKQSGSVYMQDLLNEPNTVMQMSKRMTPSKLMKMVQQHVVAEPRADTRTLN